MNIRPLIASVALTIILSGCGSTVSSAPSSASEAATTAPATEAVTEEVTTQAATTAPIKVIGEEKTGENIFKVELTNNTSEDITEFSVKTDDEEEYPDNMLAKEIFKKGESRILFYEKPKNAAAAQEDNSPVISTGYTIKVKFSSGKEAVLHNFPFGDIVKGSIENEDDTCFLVYDSKRSGDKVSTKEAEEMNEIISPEPEVTPQATEAPQEEVQNNNDNSSAYNNEPENETPNSYVETPVTPAPTDPPAPAYVPEPDPTPAPVEPTAAQNPDDGCLQGGLFY
ncbi:MAG TPA: hypothetical protein PLS20_00700 [Ruminococcus flavefaciens]|nr:hypothetical protein [Ruminococcus flavefaciens]